MNTKTHFSRQGDTMAITTVRLAPAVIEWQVILDCIKIEPDDNCEPPWECCDGYEHEIEDSNRSIHGHMAVFHNGRWKTINLEYDTDLYNWYRERGASKQVAEQLTRQSMRKRTEQLVAWHRDGWEWWQLLGEMHGCFVGLGGIDNYGYANTEYREELAFDLACQLEELGFIIKDKPCTAIKPMDKGDKRAELKRKLNSFNMN